MLTIDGNGGVHLTRGDTARLAVGINNDLLGEAYEIAAGDTLRLTVRKNWRDQTICLQKTLVGAGVFHIKPDDTSGLDVGKYTYDVELTTEDGDVYTVIEPAEFELTKEVTY